jgi:hypothetical protein
LEEEEEEEVSVSKFVHKGTTYLKDENNVIYDKESQDPIGEWNEGSEEIDLYE